MVLIKKEIKKKDTVTRGKHINISRLKCEPNKKKEPIIISKLPKRADRRADFLYDRKDTTELDKEYEGLIKVEDEAVDLLKMFLLNKVKNGQLVKVEKIFFNILRNFKKEKLFKGEEPMNIFFKLVYKLEFKFRLRQHRHSGRIYYIPFLLKYYRSYLAGIKLFYHGLRSRKNMESYIYKVYFEVKNTLLSKNNAFQEKKNTLLKEVVRNRINLRYLRKK